ncbi:MAG: hypothetical protein PHS64_02190 [Candidatus Omnitrophica bacterium]|nr:hypothetical protein [Candidatus Omnitrophota bacterium]
MKKELEETLSERATRYIQVQPHSIIPNTHFSAASSECSLMFSGGHYYGCIALVQAVSEALVRFLCEKNGWKPAKKYEENVEKLATRGTISDILKKCFLKIWDDRDDYHHLNKTIKKELKELEDLAKEKIKYLNEAEAEIFSFTASRDGVICPKNIKYWKDSGDNVYLRLGP